MLIFASFWDRFSKQFWIVFGSTFGALGGQKVVKMSSNIDAQIGIEKSRFREGMSTKCPSVLVARRGVKGKVYLPRGVRRFGRKEEKKKGRKEYSKI